jgi:hypothetical protein
MIGLLRFYSEDFALPFFRFSTSCLAKDLMYPISAAFVEEWLISFIRFATRQVFHPACSGKQTKLLPISPSVCTLWRPLASRSSAYPSGAAPLIVDS